LCSEKEANLGSLYSDNAEPVYLSFFALPSNIALQHKVTRLKDSTKNPKKSIQEVIYQQVT
ncbi:Hypothetical predicted protein, partial [Marmota monax]